MIFSPDKCAEQERRMSTETPILKKWAEEKKPEEEIEKRQRRSRKIKGVR